ncbi:VOC family protein [Niveibacterium sp. SC-1]|uniref:VOC family protein n=1 Tax=Niveibacterium sp. SC-1 TaxID=3135646 RepID=UPI00311FFC11
MNLSTLELKTFVPARDFELSKAFYLALGFALEWAGPDLAYFGHGPSRFLLQRFFVEAHAHNFVMHLLVENADDWHRHLVAQGLAARFEVALGEPEDRPWGLRDFTLHDPSGVLWRIGHDISGRVAPAFVE